MANQLTALDLELWTKVVQAKIEEESIFMDLATMRDANGAAIIHNPYTVRGVVHTYTPGQDMKENDIISIGDDLDTFVTKYYTFVYDETKSYDTEYNVVMNEQENASYALRMDMEKAFFEEYKNAYFKDGNTSLSNTNTLRVFAKANAQLGAIGVKDKKLVIVVDNFTYVDIQDYVATNGFTMADEAIKRGLKGYFAGNPLYVSSSIISTATLTPDDDLSNGDTITINGVTLTATTSFANPGDFAIGGDLASTLQNLANLINGEGSGFVEVIPEDRELLSGISAEATDTSLTVSMRGPRLVSSSIKKWGEVVSNCLVMEKGAIDFALRSPVKIISEKVQKQLARRYSAYCNYGKKLFHNNAKKVYVIPVVRQAAES